MIISFNLLEDKNCFCKSKEIFPKSKLKKINLLNILIEISLTNSI